MSIDQNAGLPIKGNLLTIYAFSFLIAALVMVVSIAGITNSNVVYPSEELVQALVTNDIVNLAIGLPVLLGSMLATWRGKLIGLFFWSGAIFFMLYNYIAYVFAMPFNWVFLLHLALVTLSLYTLIGLVAAMDGKVIRQRLSGFVPEKFAGGVLAGLGLLFFLRVIGIVINAITSGVLPTNTELAVNISDLFTTPAWVVGGILLWHRKEFGYVIGLGLLFQASMLFIALVIFLLLQPILTTAPLAVADVVIIFINWG